MGLDSPIAGRVGKKYVSFRNLSGAPPLYPDLFGASSPVPRGTFPSPEKYPKGRTEGETLSTGFLPRDPLFRDDSKGDACPPLESPA